jgi:signal transduction histidine kinase
LLAVHGRYGDAMRIAGLAASYVVAARLGLSFHPLAGFATLVWPPTGIALAALLLFGLRLWPGVFLGAAIANLLSGASPAVALGIGIGNSAEAYVAAYLLRRTRGFLITLESGTSAIALIVIGALLSTTISASFGVLTLIAGGTIATAAMHETWRVWWVGDMVGAVLIAPLILVWSRKPLARLDGRPVECFAMAVAVGVVAVLSFFGDVPRLAVLATPFHHFDLILAVMIWAAVRFGQRGATTTTVSLSAVAIVATASGHGPFVLPDLHASLLTLQTFMGILGATFLFLAGTIAERHRALDAAREAQAEAIRANGVKSEFLALMSHELRTPLNAIAGYAELLRTGVYGTLSPKQSEALARVDHNERELLTMIDAVLTFVKLEKGEIKLTPEQVRVADAFDEVEPLIKRETERKHFNLIRQLPRRPLVVRADRKGLHQILVSLISNASKFTREGGVITLGADVEDGRVHIWVRDTGIGIPEEKMVRVFEPFFQVEQGKTRSYAGVGLGLSIARELARTMDGEVTIVSKVGAGTIASVVLPAA